MPIQRQPSQVMVEVPLDRTVHFMVIVTVEFLVS